MEKPEILDTIYDEQLRRWLRSVRLPAPMVSGFFENMVFQSRFVRQFYRKHKSVLRQSGAVQRGVRGISDLDFLWGLADAIRAGTTEAKRIPSEWRRTRLCIEACVKALEQTDDMSSVAPLRAYY